MVQVVPEHQVILECVLRPGDQTPDFGDVVAQRPSENGRLRVIWGEHLWCEQPPVAVGSEFDGWAERPLSGIASERRSRSSVLPSFRLGLLCRPNETSVLGLAPSPHPL